MNIAKNIRNSIPQRVKRNSSIELLRIVAMFMIVLHHFALHAEWDFDFPNSWSTQGLTIQLLKEFGKVGVAIFFIIMGYFLFSSKNTSPSRVLKVVLPTWFWSLSIFIIVIILTRVTSNGFLGLDYALIDWKSFSLQSIFPVVYNQYWFITTYIILWLLSPYLKKLLDSMQNKELIRLLLILSAICFAPPVVGLIAQTTLPVISGIIIYLFYIILGYSICKFEYDIAKFKYLNLATTAVISVMLIAPLLQYAIDNYLNIYLADDAFRSESTIIVMLTSALLFLQFNRRRFDSKKINYIAGLTFGVYLLHENVFVRELLWDRVHLYWIHHPVNLLIFGIAVSVCIFIICCTLEAVRQYITSLLKKLTEPHTMPQKL